MHKVDVGVDLYYAERELHTVAGLAWNPVWGMMEKYAYDAYGKVRSFEHPYASGASDDRSAYNNPYHFTGRRLDQVDDTAASSPRQLYHYRGRAYDPVHGRFAQRDPAEYVDGANLYEYVTSSPASYADPSGHEATSPTSQPTTRPARRRHTTPGTFDVMMGDTAREGGVSTGVTVRYTPALEQKKCCVTIMLIQMARTMILRPWWADDIRKHERLDSRKKGENRKGEYPWPFYPHQTPGGSGGDYGQGKGQAELEDDPGFDGAIRSLDQSFETCAVCTRGSLSGTNFGCTTWGHSKKAGEPLKRWGAGYAKPPQPPSSMFGRRVIGKHGLKYRYK